MKNIPQKIYLQIGDGCPNDVEFDELSDVTWWDERIFNNDIEYVHSAWHDAESDDLPPYDKEVIVLLNKYEPFYNVCFAHRPDPAGWDGKDLDTGEIKHYQAKTYGKGGWNIFGVKWWLDVELPKVEEEEQ